MSAEYVSSLVQRPKAKMLVLAFALQAMDQDKISNGPGDGFVQYDLGNQMAPI